MTQRVTQAEFARIANVNRSTVNRWVRNGRISAGDDGRIDVADALRQRDATESPMPHHQARKTQFDEEKAAAGAPGGDGGMPLGPAAGLTGQSPVTDISTALKLETYRLQKAKAEKAAMEVDLMAGALVERAEIDFVHDDLGHTLRALIEGLADRYTGPLAAHRSDNNAIHKTLEDAARDILEEISAHLRRRMEQVNKQETEQQ